MKSSLHTLLLTTGFLIVSSCSSVKYTVDYDKKVNFYRYESYNFTPSADSIPLNQLSKRRLFDAISTEMNNSGIRWSAEPELFVHVHMMMKGRTKTNVTYGHGQTVDLGSGFSTTYMDLSEYSEGTIFFDLIDADRKQLVWTGRVTSEIRSGDRWTEKEIQQTVQRIFRKFPPRPPN